MSLNRTRRLRRLCLRYSNPSFILYLSSYSCFLNPIQVSCDLLTAAPGSSDVFPMGIVAYANEAKQRLLGIDPELLARHGAVSAECVEAMAKSVRQLAGTTYGVAVSGIAGTSHSFAFISYIVDRLVNYSNRHIR